VQRASGEPQPTSGGQVPRDDASLDAPPPALARRVPVGSEITPSGVAIRVWSPGRRKVEVVVEGAGGGSFELVAEAEGYFSGLVSTMRAGDRYRFRLDGGELLFPDPASRFQPEGPHGPSEVVDPALFAWTDASWPGVGRFGQAIYEMHIGTFTREGTWDAAIRELPELAKLGVTVLEIMPLADFPGKFGWGYDGVNWFAPTRLYGRPDDVRRFIDRAHSLGLGVILDVVYNHFGPDGNYIAQFAKDYISEKYVTEWGGALNFDGESSFGVREFVIANARYWIEEFHFDGLRLDATQTIFDASPTHILSEIVSAVREAAAPRTTLIVAENEVQHAKLVRPITAGGYGIDAVWNDDYHHSAKVALTGRREAYYTDYCGTPQELVSAIRWGYLYQGQVYSWQKKRRGTPALDLDPAAFVLFLQNHDQVANSGRGKRLHELTSPGKCRAMTAVTLLAPGTPMLLQGQEFAASARFLYFADHVPELAKLVQQGRSEFLSQFPTLALPEAQRRIADPCQASTFESCKLDFSERTTNAAAYALHCDLLELRRKDATFRDAQTLGGVDGFVLGECSFGIRLFGAEADDRLLLVNLGSQMTLSAVSEPLFAPPEGQIWRTKWSSNEIAYGGDGTPPIESERGVVIPAECTVVLSPAPP
jgi:maltooligosyltrehalose trehalohydrolase